MCPRRECSECLLWLRLLSVREVGASPSIGSAQALEGGLLDIHPQSPGSSGHEQTWVQEWPGSAPHSEVVVVPRCLFWGGQEQCESGRGRGPVHTADGPGETWDNPATRRPGHYGQLGRGSLTRVSQWCSCWMTPHGSSQHQTDQCLRDDGKPDTRTKIEQKGVLGTSTPHTASVPSPTQRCVPW